MRNIYRVVYHYEDDFTSRSFFIEAIDEVEASFKCVRLFGFHIIVTDAYKFN